MLCVASSPSSSLIPFPPLTPLPHPQASLSSIISQFLEPVLDHSKPPGIRSLKIIKVDIGTKPLQFLDVRTVPFGNEDERQFAMDFGEFLRYMVLYLMCAI